MRSGGTTLFRRFFSFLGSNLFPIVSITLISLFFVSLVLYWTKGGLLYGGDGAGFYNASNFFSYAPSPNTLVYLFSYLVGFGNVYVTFYLSLFIFSSLTGIAIFYLSYVILVNFTDRQKAEVFSVISFLLYLFNPLSISLTYINLVLSVTAETAFFILFLAYAVKYFLNSINNKKITKYDLIIMSASLGLSLPAFPNDARVYLIGTIIFLFFWLLNIALDNRNRRNRTRNVVYNLLVFLAISITFSLITSNNYTLLNNFNSILATAKAGAINKAYIGFYSGNFNEINQVLRLTDGWQFPFQAYTPLYDSATVVSAFSYLWPVLAIFVPLSFVRRKNILKIVPLEVIVLLSVFWEKGGNPPLGAIWYFITNHIPYGYQLIPTGMLTSYILLPFYAALSSYSLYILSTTAAKGVKSRLREKFSGKKIRSWRSIVTVLVVTSLVTMLMVSALPAFDGQAETTQYDSFQPSHSGFFIPNSYYEVKDYVSVFPGNMVLIPGTGNNPYFSTSWDFIGYVSFYNLFFSPENIFTLVQFGGSFYTQEQWAEYYNLTHPVLVNGSINPNFEYEALKYNIKYILMDRYELVNSSERSYLNLTGSVLSKSNVVSNVIHFGNLILYKINILAISKSEAPSLSLKSLSMVQYENGSDHYEVGKPEALIFPRCVNATLQTEYSLSMGRYSGSSQILTSNSLIPGMPKF
jgi:hypothetical protein